jgi:hypothetical protein
MLYQVKYVKPIRLPKGLVKIRPVKDSDEMTFLKGFAKADLFNERMFHPDF